MFIFLLMGIGIATGLSAHASRKYRSDAKAYVRDSIDLTDQEKKSWESLIKSLN
jgi:hypothetical protein